MVQVLPYVPGFGERIAPALEQAASTIGGALMQKRARTALEKLLQPQGNMVGGSPMNQMNQAIQQNGQANTLRPLDYVQMQRLVEMGYGPEAAKTYTNALLQDQKLAQKEAMDIRKEERALGQAGSKEFFEKIESDRLKLPEEQLASDMILNSIKSGEIDPFSKAHVAEIAKSFGVPDSILKSLETPGSKEFKTARKTFIGNTIKDAFRGTTTKIEINLAEDMLSELGVSKEGNLASYWGLQAAIDIRKERVRLADQLKSEGVPPSKIPATVDKMIQPYIRETKDEYFEAIRSLRKTKNG